MIQSKREEGREWEKSEEILARLEILKL